MASEHGLWFPKHGGGCFQRASPEEASRQLVFWECWVKSVRPFLPELWKSCSRIMPNSLGYKIKALGPVQLGEGEDAGGGGGGRGV